MLELMKTEIKTNSAKATFIRLEEKKSLDKARLFKILSAREEEETDESKEDKTRSDAFYSLYQNLRMKRVHELRKRQRNMFLVYGFLRGWDYADLEDIAYSKPDFDLIERMIFDWMPDFFDPREIKQQFEQWVQEANEHLKSVEDVVKYIDLKKERLKNKKEAA